jgi:uncharacterized protein (UPF0333 family)
MKTSIKQSAEGGKRTKSKKTCLIIWSVSLLTLIITFALQIFHIGTLNGEDNPLITIPFIFAGLAFFPSFIIWLVLKLEKRTKALGIISIACLFLVLIDYLLLRLGVGVIQNVMQPYMSIPLILAFLVFIVCFPLWLIIRFKKKAIIPAILLVVGLVVAYFIYENNLSRQRKEACTVLSQDVQENNTWLADWQTRSDTINNRVKPASNTTENDANISAVETLEILNGEFFDKSKGLLDVYSKYLNLFTSYDMNNIYKPFQEARDAQDQYDKSIVTLYQGLFSEPDNKVKTLTQNSNDAYSKMVDVQKNWASADTAFTPYVKVVSDRCYGLFNIVIPQLGIIKTQ